MIHARRKMIAGALLASTIVGVSQARADDGAAATRAALDRWRARLDAPLARVAKHDLAWVAEGAKTGGAAAGPFVLAEPAVDLSALSYVGYLEPRETGAFEGVHSMPGSLSRPFHVYRWRERFWVLTAADGRREQLAAYAVLRALTLFETRQPEAFAAVFVGPRSAQEQLDAIRANDPKKAVNFVNLTAQHAFVIEGGFDAIAKSRYDLGRKRSVSLRDGEAKRSVDLFENTATMWVNFDAIQGHRAANLYGGDDLLDAFIHYLRDGLVETVVHEGLHEMMRRDVNVRPLFWAVIRSVRALGGESLGKPCEEAIVSNVSTRLFEETDGLDPRIVRYYRGVFEQKLSSLGLKGDAPASDRGAALDALLRRHLPAPAKAKEKAKARDLLWFPIVP